MDPTGPLHANTLRAGAGPAQAPGPCQTGQRCYSYIEREYSPFMVMCEPLIQNLTQPTAAGRYLLSVKSKPLL